MLNKKKFIITIISFVLIIGFGSAVYAAFGDYWGARTFTSIIPVSTIKDLPVDVNCFSSNCKDFGSTAGRNLSYTDNGDGTISDNVTGLMWVQDGNSSGCNNGVELNWQDAINYCDNLNYAGYSDWRLPKFRELNSIVDTARYDPSINPVFINTAGTEGHYWSSTTYAGDTSNAYYVDFGYGRSSYTTNTYAYHVRCVR